MKLLKTTLWGFMPLLLLLFFQCSKEEEKAIPMLDVKQKSVSFIQQGEQKSVVVVANYEWTVSVPADAQSWLNVSELENELTITTEKNLSENARQADITISSAGLLAKVSVSQFGIIVEILAEDKVSAEYQKSVYQLTVSSNTDYDIIIADNVGWLKVIEKPESRLGLTDKVHHLEFAPNYTGLLRSTVLAIKQKDGKAEKLVSINQKSFELTNETLPVDDIKIPVKSAWTSSFYSQEPITLAIDDNKNTFWHSAWGTSTWPITAIFYFENADIDYLTYYPRASHTNGNFKELNLYVSYTQNPDKDNSSHWELQGNHDFDGSSSPSDINFTSTLLNPTAIKFEVLSGVGDNSNGFASCAEMQFYKKRSFDVDFTQFFIDDICSAVKSGITESDILTSDMPSLFKSIAIQQMAGNYSPYRVQPYEAFRPVADLAKEFKTSTYNQYENPTGIWLKEGEEVYIFVADTKGEKISLISRNWTDDKTSTYSLKTGINLIKPSHTGQAYISYYTTKYKTAQPIKIHIAGGEINGYFKRGVNTAAEWASILNKAAGDHLDIVGNYTTCIFHIPSLKANCPNDGLKLIEIYDEIIELEYELMGLLKYQKVPKNNMLGRNMPGGFMHADGLGAAFVNSSMNSIGNPANIIKGDNSWGIAHEYGHVNQIRPGLKWVGTAEVTNNIFSSYVQYILTSKYSTLNLRLEHENCTDIQGGSGIIGGRFNSHLHYGVLKGDKWIFQWGQDSNSDHFVKLVPLWQLNLYYKIAKNTDWYKPDWYADICEETRNTSDVGVSNGQHQINFMKRVCKYTETDLTDFFEKAGMLKPIDESIDDYGVQRLTITDDMCNQVRTYVQTNGWQKPAGEINYISGNTIKIYEGKLAVQGTLNQGITGSGTTRTVSHNTWKNAVVYETYAGAEVVRLTMAGTGTTNNSLTIVPYPSGATKIVAVAWDGARTIVYQP